MKSDSAPASAGDITGRLDRSASAPRATYRLLNARGLGHDEAGNLTAYLCGLTPVAGGWRLVEIERLLFLRHLVEHGHLRSARADAPTRAPSAGIP